MIARIISLLVGRSSKSTDDYGRFRKKGIIHSAFKKGILFFCNVFY